jgi:hypothetical protein
MELGVDLFFLIVFGFGSLLLLGLIVYFIREFVIRKDRPKWSARTPQSKTVFIVALLLVVLVAFVPGRMIWVTRVAAIPGRYSTDGVWGNATLVMQRDGSFVETWHLKNEYNGTPEGSGSTQGRWHDSGRDWFTRDVSLEPFRPLAEYDRGHTYISLSASLEGYSGFTAIHVDFGEDIAFFK